MNYQKIVLTSRQKAWLVKHFKNTKNDVIAEKIGISHSTLHRFARELGLKKTDRFMGKCQKDTADAARRSHLANGTYPPKGYRIPRSEEFQYEPGLKPWERCGKRKWNAAVRKGAAKRRQTFREEKARVIFGLEQKTRLRVIRQPKQKIVDRCYLKRRGYVLDEANVIAYWTPETQRCTRLEARPRRFYKFAPMP